MAFVEKEDEVLSFTEFRVWLIKLFGIVELPESDGATRLQEDLDLDSLSMIELACALEELVGRGIPVSLDALGNWETVSEVYASYCVLVQVPDPKGF